MEELLEHLRGRLDEVALDTEGAGAGEGDLAADHMMHEVAELVQEDHDIAVLHQTRVARGAAREVAHQHALGKLAAVNAGGERLGGEPFVLALARMHVEVDAPEPGVALVDVIGGRPKGARCARPPPGGCRRETAARRWRSRRARPPRRESKDARSGSRS